MSVKAIKLLSPDAKVIFNQRQPHARIVSANHGYGEIVHLFMMLFFGSFETPSLPVASCFGSLLTWLLHRLHPPYLRT